MKSYSIHLLRWASFYTRCHVFKFLPSFLLPNNILFLERERIGCAIICQFMEFSQWFGWMVREMKEHNLKINDKETWRVSCIDPLNGQKNMKLFVSLVNAHQRVTSAREYFNKVTERSPALWLSVSLFPHPPPVIAQWPCWQRWRLCIGPAPWLPLTKASLTMATTECSIYKQRTPALRFTYGSIPEVDQPATW